MREIVSPLGGFLSPFARRDSAAFNIAFTGLTDGVAIVGDHASIGYTITPDNGTEAVAWGVASNDDTFGTGSAPTDITGGDDGILVLSVTDGGVTRYLSAPIRREAAENTAAPAIQSTGTGLGDTITMTPGTWTGDAGGAFTERLFRDGDPLVVGSPTVSYEIDIADSEAVITGTREYTNSGGTTSVSATGSVTVDDLVAVPDAFGDEDWEFVNGDDASTLEINILALPFNNGSEITDIEYRVDGGSAVSLGTTETGAYVLPGTVVGTEYDAEIRAVNGEGAGPWSSVKSATPAEAPDAFEVGDWTLTDLASGGDARVAISALPGSNGAELTQLDYRIDGGTWQLLTASPSVGNFDLLDVFTDGVEGDVEIRARNSAGIGDASDVKSVTTTLVTPTLNITSAVFTPGSGGNPASVETEVEEDSTTGPYTLFGATHANATTLTAANIENGTGDAEDTFSIGPEADVVDLDDALSFSTTLPYGARMSIFIRDSAGTPKESDVFQIVNIEVDADAPTLSSGSPADNATDVAIDTTPALTFSKPIFGVAGKDFYLYDDIDTTPVLVETFTFDDATSATGDNGGSASISGSVITITPGADMADGTQHSIRWEADAVKSAWATPVAANTGDTAYNFTTEAVAGAAFLERIVGTAGQPTFYSEDTSASFTDTIDVSGRTAGDNLIVFCGLYNGITGLTVNGNSAGSAVVATTFGTNRYITVFQYTLQAADITAGTIDVVLTYSAGKNDCMMDMFLTSGSIADTDTSNHGPSSPGSVAVTPTQATNGIIHVAMGTDDTFDGASGFVYTAVITAREYNFDGDRFGAAAGIALNAPTSEQTITWTEDGSSFQYATVAVVVE
jgi:hypothetical protein